MGDMGVAQAVGTIVSRDALINQIILIETIGSQYKEVVASLMDILHLMVGQIMLPSADLRPCRAK